MRRSRQLPSPNSTEQGDYPLDLYMRRQQRANLMTSPDQTLSRIIEIKAPTNYDSAALRTTFDAPLQVPDVFTRDDESNNLSFNKTNDRAAIMEAPKSIRK